MPDPKQVHRRACKEISANGKFEEEYLKVQGASAWQLYLQSSWVMIPAIHQHEIFKRTPLMRLVVARIH